MKPREKNRGSPFQVIPGIGPSLARDLSDLGFREVADLNGADPQAMYENLIRLRGVHQDRCVLYVFRCAVYFASQAAPDPELLKWWNWKDRVRLPTDPENGGRSC